MKRDQKQLIKLIQENSHHDLPACKDKNCLKTHHYLLCPYDLLVRLGVKDAENAFD